MIQPRVLSSVPLLAGLSAENLAWLGEHSRLQPVSKGAFVIQKGATGTDFLFLAQGRLMVVDISPEGQEIGLHIIEPGEHFGELSVIDGEPRSASVRAMEDSTLGVFTREVFNELVTRDPQIAISLMRRLARTVRASNQRRVIMSIHSVPKRVVAVLLNAVAQMGVQDGQPVKLPTQQELANLANTTRESVSRVLSALQQQGLIEKQGHQVIIRDLKALSNWTPASDKV